MDLLLLSQLPPHLTLPTPLASSSLRIPEGPTKGWTHQIPLVFDELGHEHREGYFHGVKDLVCKLTEAGVITDWDLTHDHNQLHPILFLSTDSLDSERDTFDYSREASLALEELPPHPDDHQSLPPVSLSPSKRWDRSLKPRASQYVIGTQGGGKVHIHMTNYSSTPICDIDISKAANPHEEGVMRLIEVGEDQEARSLVGAWELNRIKALGMQ